MIVRRTSLTEYILDFGRYLRSQGFATTTTHLQDSLTLLDLSSLRDSETMQLLLRSTLCHSLSEFRDFDGHYLTYWKEQTRGEDSKIMEETEKNRSQPPRPSASLQQLKEWLQGNHQEEQLVAETYSKAPALEDVDFAELSQEEILAMYRMLKKLARRWQHLQSRRYQRTRRINLFDPRQTMRYALASQGEILQFRYRKPKKRKFRLVVISDISRSMQLYSRFIMHFMIALGNLFDDVESFVFSLDIRRITADLPRNSHNPENLRLALEELAASSGGTEIGRSLQSYVDQYAPSQLSRQSKVIIISDGWDLGDSDLIENAMYSIHSMCRQLIWINPLKGNPNYTPEVKGMKAALPFIDHFTSCHNLKSLEALVPVLFSSRRKVK